MKKIISLFLVILTVFSVFIVVTYGEEAEFLSGFENSCASNYYYKWIDVTNNTPNYDAINAAGYITINGNRLMSGTGNNFFQPNASMKRSEAAQMMYTLAGRPYGDSYSAGALNKKNQYQYTHKMTIEGTAEIHRLDGQCTTTVYISIGGSEKSATTNASSSQVEKTIKRALKGYENDTEWYEYVSCSSKYIPSIKDTFLDTSRYEITVTVMLHASAPFLDMETKSWYSTAMLWCYNNGVIVGTQAYTPGKLGMVQPNKEVTRQEAAQLFYAFAKSQGKSVSKKIKWSDYSLGNWVNTPYGAQVMITDVQHPFSWGDDALRWMLALDKNCCCIWENAANNMANLTGSVPDNKALTVMSNSKTYLVNATKPMPRHELAGLSMLYLREYYPLTGSLLECNTIAAKMGEAMKAKNNSVKIVTTNNNSNSKCIYACVGDPRSLVDGLYGAQKWGELFVNAVVAKTGLVNFTKYTWTFKATVASDGRLYLYAYYK